MLIKILTSKQYKALQEENQRLKEENAELIERAKWNAREQRTHNENMRNEIAKLKRLALHGMFGYACAKMNVLVEKYEKEFSSGMVHKDFSRWHRLSRLWLEAYRKAKKDLRERK